MVIYFFRLLIFWGAKFPWFKLPMKNCYHENFDIVILFAPQDLEHGAEEFGKDVCVCGNHVYRYMESSSERNTCLFQGAV